MKIYEPLGGESINETARAMVVIYLESGEQVTAQFNGIELTAAANSTTEESIVHFYWQESNRRHDAYLASPEHAQHQREMEIRQKDRETHLKAALATAPEHLTLSDSPAWEEWLKNNTDGYGAAVMRYAETWARVMESRIQQGEKLEDCADGASHIADSEGITGAMYGFAVGVLSKVWIHGEQLRRWHNLKTQIHDEGEKANESGGVLNPAMLNIQVP